VIPVQKYLPANSPLVDDNSEFNLAGYKNVLLEPKVHVDDTLVMLKVRENPSVFNKNGVK
jgi:hypothetical protein